MVVQHAEQYRRSGVVRQHRRLAAMPSQALAQTRRLIDAAMPMAFDDALVQEANVQRELGHAPDFAEGVSAFFAKRPAVFKDR